MLLALAGSALAQTTWTATPLFVGTDVAGPTGDVASSVAIAVDPATGDPWFVVERERPGGARRSHSLFAGVLDCDGDVCAPSPLQRIGVPQIRPNRAALALEPGGGEPRVHVLRNVRNGVRCATGASDLEEWIWDPATGAVRSLPVDVPAGCDEAGAATASFDGDRFGACWAVSAGSDLETWCGTRVPGGAWSADLLADGVLAQDQHAHLLDDGAPLAVWRDRDPNPDVVRVGALGQPPIALPTDGAGRPASDPSIARAPDGSLHAVWLDGSRRVAYARCEAADCGDPASWVLQPRAVRIGDAGDLAQPEIAIAGNGRMFVSYREDVDPGPDETWRVFVKEACRTAAAFPPADLQGEPVGTPADPSDDQVLSDGGPHLWVDDATRTVHVAWIEQDRAVSPTRGSAFVARKSVGWCSPPRDPRVDAFVEAAEDAGFRVQEGGYAFLEPTDCCAAGASCDGGNPRGSYGYAMLPPAPGQTSLDGGMEIDGTHQYFHLGSDEVVVLLGETPPPLVYFGYRTHISDREIGGVMDYVLTTNGLDLNIWNVRQSRGTDDVFEQPIAVVTSSDANAESLVHGLLAGAGYDPTWIEDDRISADTTRLGLGDLDDRLGIIHRAAIFDDPTDELAYRADPGLVTLRLTPTMPLVPPAPFASPAPPVTGSGTDESAWADSLDALEAAIVAAWPAFAATPIRLHTGTPDPEYCLSTGVVCGDLSSRIWTRTELFEMPLDGSFAIAFGANHERTGKATYSSFAAQTWAHHVGLDALLSPDMVGTATPFLPTDPLADDLFAVVFARDCSLFHGFACIDIPVGCPGVEPNGQLYGAGRIYLDPVTGTSPDPAELLDDRVIVFHP